MIDQSATHSRQQLGAVYRIKEYLSQSGLTIAFKYFLDQYVSTATSFLWKLLSLICIK